MKSLSDIINYLRLVIEDVSLGKINRNEISGDSVILDLGIDSLDFASIMLAGETFVSSKVNEDGIDWRNVRTVSQLAELLYKSQKL
jgi:acyl carrier protein